MTDDMYILDRSGDDRLTRLRDLEAYFDGRQFDHLGHDWWGDTIERSRPYLHLRTAWSNRVLGIIRARPLAAIARRPCIQTGLPGQIRQTFTNEVIGKMPPVEVIADKDATECLGAMLDEAKAGEAFAQCRNLGAVGSSAIVVDVVDGEPCLTPRRSSELLVSAWESMERWIPSDVVYQRRAMEYRYERGKSKPVVVVKTTRYTATEVIEYEDVELAKHDREKPIPEKPDGRREHHAGRCPVVWHQNSMSADCPEGKHDLETEAVLEQSDRADALFSSVFTASQSNAEPTVVRSDRMDASHIFGSKIAKGNGKLIQVSEQGKVYFLEISGASIQAAWDTLDKTIRLIQKGASCIIPDLDFGGLKTATEVERVWTSQDSKVKRLRSALDGTIVQVCEILLEMARALGVTSKEDPDRESSVVLPPKTTCEDDDEGGEIVTTEIFDPGKGRTVVVRWPASRQVQPKDLPGVLNAMGMSCGGQQTLSRETAVGESLGAIGRTDVREELRRIEHDEHEKQERGAAMFAPDTINERAENAADASEQGDEEGAPVSKSPDGVEEPEDKAGDSRKDD